MKIRVILFGATGMVGEGVLHEALLSPEVDSILAIGRRACGVKHPKLEEVLHDDFFDYSPIEEKLCGYTACFFCLGVSSLGMAEEKYRRLTYDLTMSAARTLSRLNPAMTFCYVSGAGTDSSEQGRIMWARVKGKTENDLAKLPFKAVYLFRPGYIRPTRGLKNAFFFARALAPLYPLLKAGFSRYVCTLEDVGRAMIQVSSQGYPQGILECRDIARAAAMESKETG